MLNFRLVGPDVLGDAASFSGGDGSLSYIIQQSGLAMVNMAHHDDNGRAGWRNLNFFGLFFIKPKLYLIFIFL